jgi:outer membrane protein
VIKKTIAIVLGIFLINSSFATNLWEVYQEALRNDPTYQNAIATYKDNQEVLSQAYAALMLSAGLQANTSFTRYSLFNPIFGVSSANFNTHGYAINLDQPLFNFASISRVGMAKSNVKAALATLLASRQNLILRVANAYFSELFAEDTLSFTRAEKKFMKQQLDQTQQRYKVGLDAITSVYDAEASYDAVTASEINAENAVQNSKEQLRTITGAYDEKLNPLKKDIPLTSPHPQQSEAWIKIAEKNNIPLLAAEFSSLAARDNIKVQFAGHLPTIDATGSYQHTGGVANPLYNTAGNQKIAALQLDFPIFSGGMIVSKTRQAQYQYIEAITALDKVHRDVINNTHQTYNNLLSGVSKIRADHQAIVSRNASLQGDVEAYKVGTRTMVDVLNDQQQLTQAQQTYAQDRYAYINNILLLKQNAGTLKDTDMLMINQFLKSK